MKTTEIDRRVTGAALRDAMRHWAAGVTVITAAPEPGRRIGLVSNSFTSVSLDPPLVSWCIDRSSTHYDDWEHIEVFSIHVLGGDDADLIPRFAAKGTDKFAGLSTTPGPLGTPVLDAGTVRFDCRTWRTYDGGDHLIIVGTVAHIEHLRKDPT